MARPSFTNIFPGNRHYEDFDGTSPSDVLVRSSEVSESCSGVTRHKPSGWIPPTGYTFSSRYVAYANGLYERRIPAQTHKGQRYSGIIGQGAGHHNSLNHFDEAVSESTAMSGGSTASNALLRARNNLKGMDINLGAAYGERKQTANLLGDTAIRLAKSYKSLRRGEIRNAMRQLGISPSRSQPRGSTAPQKWLELQYGWKPLLSDVYGACDALSKRDKKDWRVTARGRASETAQWTYRLNPHVTANSDPHYVVAESRRSSFCRIDALPQNEALISLASVGVTNPLLVAWERLPFSFVVDWALPIGGWLESLDALLGYTSAYTSNSTLVKCEWVGTGLSEVFSPGNFVNANYIERKRMISLVRAASSGVPLPTFPRVKDPLSLGHMANGLSLLAQAFGRR